MLRRYFGKISPLQIGNLVGHNGELVIDEQTDSLYIMDGITPGGHKIYAGNVFVTGGTTSLVMPTDPVSGSTWYNVDTNKLYVYVNGTWVEANPSLGNTNLVRPENPEPGALWYDTDTGRTYIYYDENWVDSNPGVKGDAGPTGPTGATGAQGYAGLNSQLLGTFDSVDQLLAAFPVPQDNFWAFAKDPDPTVLHIYRPDPGGWVSETIIVPQGPTGDMGTAGATGSTGANGDAGPTGPTGTQGPPGDQGVQGIQGTSGPQGDAGPRGLSGTQGVSVTLKGTKATIADLPGTGTSGDAWIVTTGDGGSHLDGSLWFWNSDAGVWNDIGKIVGPPGDVGAQGPRGFDGSVGPTGPKGNDGTNGTNGNNGATGATGAVGPTGPAGSGGGGSPTTGPTGATGPTGEAGVAGSAGPTGATGTNGDTGPTGATGTFSGTTDQQIITTNTTNSVSTTTGALQVAGGAGIGNDVHIGGILQVTDTTPSTSYDTGAVIINGGLGVNGNINLTGNINILNGNINIQEFSGSTGNFYGDPITGFGAMYAGKTGFTPIPFTVAQFSTNSNSYSQINTENISSGKLASSDYIGTGDIGDDANWFFDLGIAGSGYDPVLAAQNNALGTSIGPLDTYLYVQGSAAVPEKGGNLTIGTSQVDKVVKFIAGGVNAENVILTVAQNKVTSNQDIYATNVYASNLAYSSNISYLQNELDAANAVIATKTSYSNTNVAAYLLANPQGSSGTNYSNSNVTSYLSGSISVGNISSANGYYWANGAVYAPSVNTLTNGSNTLKLVSAPATLSGASGDTAGSIAFDSGYVYYCTRNFTSGSYVYNYTVNATIGSMNAYLPPTNITLGSLVYIQGPMPIAPTTGWTLTYNGTSYSVVAGGNPNNGVFSQVYLSGTGMNIPAGAAVTITAPVGATIWTRTPWNASDRYGFSTTTAAASGGGSLSYNNINGQFTFAPAVTSNPTFTAGLAISGSMSATAWGTAGVGFRTVTNTYTDATSSGTVTNNMVHAISAPTLASASAVTYTNAATLYIANVPTSGTNVTVTNKYSLWVNAGDSYFGGQVIMPNRPAFRVYGNNGTTVSTTTNTTGILNATNWNIEYSQGTGFNSATGIFVAPVAGLYSVALTARAKDNASPMSSILVKKNAYNASTGSTVVYVEWAANTTSNHMGSAGHVKLAIGDNLSVYVTAGTCTFDVNDNWSVAFIG